MANQKPGDGFLGWLGRQIGHVKRAVKTDVTKKADAATPQVVHRETNVQEAAIPDKPGVLLRRTVIDEVIVENKEKSQ